MQNSFVEMGEEFIIPVRSCFFKEILIVVGSL